MNIISNINNTINTCIICHCIPNIETVTPCCKKLFCKYCMNQWLFKYNKNYCPHCRKEFYIKNKIKLDEFIEEHKTYYISFPLLIKLLYYPIILIEYKWKTRKRKNQIEYNLD